MKERSSFPVTAIVVCALILSLLLVFAIDGARLLLPKSTDRIRAEILLEDLDSAAAEALLSENELSVDGSTPCRVLATAEPESLLRLEESADGRILALPSRRRFSVRLSLLLVGREDEEGFLAFGSRRILPGAHVRLDGERVTAEGRVLALKPAEA